MIDSELAKQLKDAGFPTFRKNWDLEINPESRPTFSELIEACGGQFYMLINQTPPHTGSFAAMNYGASKKGAGKTPEEAVAKLWLELNKKKL